MEKHSKLFTVKEMQTEINEMSVHTGIRQLLSKQIIKRVTEYTGKLILFMGTLQNNLEVPQNSIYKVIIRLSTFIRSYLHTIYLHKIMISSHT